MSEKNTQSRAEKAVSEAKKSPKAAAPKPKKPVAPRKNTPNVKTEYEKDSIPVNGIIAVVSLGLFVLFAVMSVNPDGALLKILKNVILGFIGQAGFLFAIPGLLYLFIIHTFSRKVALRMRSVCIGLLVLSAGCLFHLVVYQSTGTQGLGIPPDLYASGVEGKSGGILCGGIAMLVQYLCGTWISYILFGLMGTLSVLGAFQITIPSIIRAIQDRPRDDFLEEEDEFIEPAAIVVNHIANRQIEQRRKRRQRMEEVQMLPEEKDLSEPQMLPAPSAKKSAPKAPSKVLIPEQEPEATAGNPANILGALDAEIGGKKPVRPVQVTASEPELAAEPRNSMPALNLEEVLPPLPKVQPEKTEEKKKVTAKEAAASAAQVTAEIERNLAEEKAEYCFPPMDLLKKPSKGSADGTEEMRENSRRLNEILASFNIDAHIINVTRGPSVTRYEVELDKGVRLSKLTGSADDIALSLGAVGVRIAAVPGKISVVGIEVPNRTVTTVSLREVIDSQEFSRARSKTSISLGKSIDGNCVVGNISKMPHLLIAGTTGSGKSVCMNSIIVSLLYKASPEDVKLIMVDPKMVELGIYNGIPHLLIPVVTDPKKAAGSLQWAVTEMMRRYKYMSDVGVRDLESYNSIIEAEGEGEKLPNVVVIIDELADLMMVAAKEVEESICRIAQMGRAAGMHLIIATQRPSANVITGLMKANIPSRIAFSVASAMESRIILDTQGAEKLVGRGDMLYAPIGSGKPLRVQGCFVTDEEVEAVASYVKESYEVTYNKDVLEEIERSAQQTGKKPAAMEVEPTSEELEGDELLPQAVDVILETNQASVSMLQRRLKLGYARAARIVDEMEEKGIVGPFQGSKPRAILITKEQWEAQKGQDPQMSIADMEETGDLPF